MRFRSAPVLALVLGLAAEASAQVTAEDYRRAEQFLSWNATKLVKNAEVRPHWIGATDRFWYRRELADGKEFMLVDARSGRRSPAFDHARLAQALSAAADTTVTATSLPFDSLSFDPGLTQVRFTALKRIFGCDLKGYTCRAEGPAPSPNAGEALSPDGAWAAFIRGHDLWIRNTASKEEVRLTSDGAENFDYASQPGSNTSAVTQRLSGAPAPPGVLWSPDSRKLLTYRLDQRQVREMHLLQMVPKQGYAAVHYSYRYPLPGDTAVALAHFLVIDVAERRVTPLQSPAHEVQFITPLARRFVWWDDHGKAFYALRVGRGQKSLSLEAVDPATGAVKTVLREEASASFVEPHLLIGMEPNVRVLSATREVVWFSERDGHAGLYLFDDAGNLKNRITPAPLVVRDLVRVDPKTRRVFFLAGGKEPGDPYFRRFYSVGLDGTGLKLLTPEDADHTVSLSPTGGFFVDNYSRMDTVPASRLRRTDGREVMELERADLSRLLAAGFRFPERFIAKATDGVTDIHGLIFRPGKFDPSKKYPVLDDIYPGPQNIRTPKAFSAGVLDPASMAELGFIVVLVDGRGTPFRSKAFHDHSYGKLEQAGTLEDHIAALRQLAQRDPSFDLSRVGIYGHSGGGFAAARAILAHPDFYKVAVASAGNHDQRGYIALWGELYQGYPVSEAWTAQANAGLADRLQGKLLLMTGDLDDNVHPALTMQVVDALVKANKDFDLIILPNRNHGSVADPYFIRRRWDYFVQHLLGATPPANYRIQGPGAGAR